MLVLHNFLMAVEDWSADFVEDAVTLFIKGQVPGHDGRFAPTPSQLATACNIVAEKASRARYLNGLSQPRLPPPDIVHTEEERERVAAKVKAFSEVQGSIMAHENSVDTQRRRERWAKTNARFQPPMDDASISQRLLGYSVGAPESEDNAA